MAITLINRPEGHKLDTEPHEATIYDDGAGNVLVYTGVAHGLGDGDYVLIDSNLDGYNGIFYVDSIAYDYFKIKESATGDYIPFIQEAEIYFYISVLSHGWQCVHLPIVYELESDLFPTNDNNPRTILSQSDDNGWTDLNLSGALTDSTELSKIELVGDGPLAGVYQIYTENSSSDVTIDLAYDAGNSFTGYIVVKYYDNYAINVNVYAGLPAGHRWEDTKPYELAGTLKFIPGDDNRIKFSISEILRAYIETRNNLTLNTLPNNTDFLVAFYIEYFESYDESDGSEITTFEGDVTTDDFEGYAVNAKLPFKSESGSFLSDYVNSGNILARWLTLMETPIAIVGYFFDLSFINQYNGATINITKNGAPFLTIENPGLGIIRVPYQPQEGDIESCFQAVISSDEEVPVSFLGFANRGLSGTDWVLGSSPSVTIVSAFGGASDYLYKSISLIPSITYEFTINTVGLVGTITCTLRDDDFNIIDSDNASIAGGGLKTFTLVATENTTIIAFRWTVGTNGSLTISDLIYSVSEPVPITEGICVQVLQECQPTQIVRETESGQFRILE